MATDLKSILRLEVPVIVRIASRIMKVGEVAKLTPGAIVELPKLADEELDVLISNRPIGKGTAVKVGENFGIRISTVGNQRERVEAMGDAEATESEPESGAEMETTSEIAAESAADADQP
jgi:flagellar motor switch protein FliN